MNERIRELAEQATKQVTKPDGHYIVQEWQKVFAELIVQECAKEIIRQNHNIASTEWEEGYEAGFQTASTLILKHFGVEE